MKQDQVSIGQSAEVEICLDGKNVLPWHALVGKREDGYFISDLGSSSGTFVNEKKVVESPLKTGDRIQIDHFLIEFFVGVPYVKPSQKSASVESAVDVKKPLEVKEPPSVEEKVEKSAQKPKKKTVKKKTVSPSKKKKSPPKKKTEKSLPETNPQESTPPVQEVSVKAPPPKGEQPAVCIFSLC